MWEQTFANMLKEHFEALKKKNRRYSLRSFAKRIGLSPSALSGLFTGKVQWKLSEKRALKILNQLQIPQAQRNLILVLMGKPPENTLTDIPEKDFPMLLDWTFVPTLVSHYLPSSHSSLAEIAKRLGKPVEHVEAVQAKLIELGYLEKKSNGEIHPAQGPLVAGDKVPNDVLKQYHQDNLTLGQRALHAVPFEKRHVGCITLAGDETQMVRMQKEIQDFYQRIQTIMDSASEKKNVFRLSIQLFPIDFSQHLEATQ